MSDPPSDVASLSQRPSRLRRASWVALLLALAGVTALVAWQGLGAVAAAMAHVGFKLLWLVPLFALPLLLATLAWRLLFVRGGAPALLPALFAAWIGLAINWLLPVAQVGGELARARLVHRRGTDGSVALATAVADKTVQTVSQALYTLVGVALLLAFYTAGSLQVVLAGLLVAALLGLGVWGFYRVQQRGMFAWLARTAARMTPGKRADLHADAEATDAALRTLYTRRRRFIAALALSLAHRFALALEVYLLLGWLGVEATLADAILLESLGQAVRAAAFIIPGGLFAQEGSYLVLGALLGIAEPTALAISLGKRARELLVGLPALLVWQLDEARAMRRGRR